MSMCAVGMVLTHVLHVSHPELARQHDLQVAVTEDPGGATQHELQVCHRRQPAEKQEIHALSDVYASSGGLHFPAVALRDLHHEQHPRRPVQQLTHNLIREIQNTETRRVFDPPSRRLLNTQSVFLLRSLNTCNETENKHK